MQKIQRLGTAIAKLQARQLQEIAAHPADRRHARDVATELAATLAINDHAAAKQLALAQALTTRLPRTLAAMHRELLDAGKATKIAEPTACLSDEHARQVDTLLAGSPATTPAASAAPPVELLHHGDAMTTLVADLPAETGSAIYSRLDPSPADGAAPATPAPRPTPRRRVRRPPAHRRSRRHLRRQSRHPRLRRLHTLTGPNQHPAELAGHGPIPAWLARHIAADPHSTWRRIITAPSTGLPLDVDDAATAHPPSPPTTSASATANAATPPATAPPSSARSTTPPPGNTNTRELAGYCTRHHHTRHQPEWSHHPDHHSGTHHHHPLRTTAHQHTRTTARATPPTRRSATVLTTHLTTEGGMPAVTHGRAREAVRRRSTKGGTHSSGRHHAR